MCMPTIVYCLGNNTFRPKDDRGPREGMVYNTLTGVTEKGLLMGYQVGDTEAPGVTDAQRVVRLGRAMDGHTRRWLGAFCYRRGPP